MPFDTNSDVANRCPLETQPTHSTASTTNLTAVNTRIEEAKQKGRTYRESEVQDGPPGCQLEDLSLSRLHPPP